MRHAIFATMLSGGLLAAATQTVVAQGTIYASRTLFAQQLNSSTTITMESLQASSDADFVWGLGNSNINVGGVTIMSSAALLFVSNPGHMAYPIAGDGQYIFNYDSSSPVSILLPSGVNAFGADFSGGRTGNLSYDATLWVNLAGGGSYAFNFTGTEGSWTFFGVTFPEPISSLIYSDGGISLHEEMLDNVTFGVIPEPGSFGLLALGGFLLGWRLRRRSAT